MSFACTIPLVFNVVVEHPLTRHVRSRRLTERTHIIDLVLANDNAEFRSEVNLEDLDEAGQLNAHAIADGLIGGLPLAVLPHLSPEVRTYIVASAQALLDAGAGPRKED